MKLLIKVLNESNLYPSLNLDGLSGKPYTFLWNKSLDAYACAPKDQGEINDIFGTQGVICPWHLSPVIVEGDGPTVDSRPATVPPFIARRLYENHTDAELVALAADVGIELQGPKERENLLRQLDAYMQGRAWGVKEPIQLPPAAPTLDTAAHELGQKLKDAHTEQERLRKEVKDQAVLTKTVASLELRLAAAEKALAQSEKSLAASKKQNGTLRHQLSQAVIAKVRLSPRKPAPATPPTPPETEAVVETNV